MSLELYRTHLDGLNLTIQEENELIEIMTILVAYSDDVDHWFRSILISNSDSA